jgi:YD repeat-containing protein
MFFPYPSPSAQRKISVILICYLLLLSGVAPFTVARARHASAGSPRLQQESVAVTGAPVGVFPNLDTIKSQQLPQPIAPSSIPSAMRSRRNPLAPRTVMRVGDPLPSPLTTPQPSPSIFPSPSPVPTPVASPLPSPSNSPSTSPLPSPSIPPLPLVLARPGVGSAAAPWTNGRNGEGLSQVLVAWNHSYPTFYPENFFAPRLAASLPDSIIPANVGFDFYLLPMPQNGSSKVIFTSNRDGNRQVYSMNIDGSGLIRLTNNSYNDDHPRWSPNGTKILFQSDRDSLPPDPENPEPAKQDIYVMNADGTGQTRLTTDSADDCNAVWSPDGSKIIFQSRRNGLNYQIFVMNPDGSNQANVSNSGAADYQPSWSPSGSKIAFASERDHADAPSIYVMNVNGSSQTRLTFSSELVKDQEPEWSPDVTKIAFVSNRDGNKEIYSMNADGGNQLRLTTTLENEDSPHWSADGTKIVFRSERERDTYDPGQQLWTMNADGTNQSLIASNEFGDSSPSWGTTTGNQSPIASSGGPYSGVIAQNVPFSGTGSFDPDGSISSYSWTFGDGGTASGVSPTHTYVSAGTYNISLTVTDNLGAQTTANTTAMVTTAASEQYLANFNLAALSRQPYTNESAYWNDILRAAYPNGQSSMLLALRELGKTLFESSDYAGRNRDNHGYVYDLYKTYLMREPDTSGWAFWENECAVSGREQVRRAFDECTEFAGIVATLTPSGTPSSNVSSLTSARVDPFNQPGNGLASRDTEWSVSLLSLPGRAGLDLGLSLSYSSMVWTHSGPYIYFDEDNGWPSPGFRLGFPSVQQKSFDAQAGRNVYLIVSGGSRVSLRQVGTSNIYEAADSSYLQLIDNGGSLLVRTTDGMQLNYQGYNNEWRCTQIKDRNGNYITVNYDWLGHITTIVDTLNRTLTFIYDSNANLTAITQSWTVNGSPQTHTWASFGWTTKQIQPSFSGSMVVGANPATTPVIDQVGFNDGTYSKFLYNSAGQVTRITQYASDSNPLYDNHPRSYTAYDYNGASDDCPRVSATRVWAENWTGINGVAAEVTTQYGIEGDTHTVYVVGDPNGRVDKEFYGTGWQRGLTTQTEVWAGGVRQKWTTTNWTQDNTGVGYQTNPRVTETNIYDAGGNRRRTTTSYGSFVLPSGGSCRLPVEVREYAADATTTLRHSNTDYRMDLTADAAYLDRHIIGLVKNRTLYEGNGTSTPMSKVHVEYDETGSIQGTDAPVQHDSNYGTIFLSGRANPSSVTSYDVTDTSQFTVSNMKYNTAGAVVSATDPLGHQDSIGYTDSFSADGNNLDPARSFVTLAYPTTVTDADGNNSYLRYHYDFGAKTRAQGPRPQNQSQGVIQLFAYDNASRLERVTTTNNGAYVHYVYGPNYVQSFATVNNLLDEAYSIQVFDGNGRVTGIADNHPNSFGGYSARNTIYDQMGRAVKQSNPAEINASWAPAGDDSAGWLYAQQTYDWKGRPLVTTNTDGTTKEASYAGCGCAGGEVTTLTDEGTLDGGIAKRRQQKIYADVLGRTAKTQLFNWQDGSAYSTTVNTYNARDQVKLVQQFQGAEDNENHQDTTMTYDGYGRLKTTHVPRQDADTFTTYNYNADDTVLSVIDARGASQTFSYNNNRHLPTSITYSAPAGIAPTPNVTFTYDAVGSRTFMSDGLGSVSYQYDQLSRMTSETRTFADPGNAINGVTKTISYDYNFANELKSITDPAGLTINYGFDVAGRLNNVTGSAFGTVSTYASDAQYRAWGGLKHLSYGDSKTLDATYNSRLQPASFSIPGVMSKTYDYSADGQLRFSSDLLNHKFDRSYSHDHLGRLTAAFSGAEARGEAATNDRPYKQTFTYDGFNHLTVRTSNNWNDYYTMPADSYVNDRRAGSDYDAEGNLLGSPEATYTYDARGEIHTAGTYEPQSTTIRGLDGDGQQLRTVESTFNETTQAWASTTTYYLHSTILGGQVLTELAEDGAKARTFVYAGGAVLATHTSYGTNQAVEWEHRDPSNASFRLTVAGGSVLEQAELDPLNADAGTHAPLVSPAPQDDSGTSMLPYPSFTSAQSGLGTSYRVDGIIVSADYAMLQIDSLFHGSSLQMAEYFTTGRLRNYEVGGVDFGLNKNRAIGEALETQSTLIRNWVVYDNWSFAIGLFPRTPISAPGPQNSAQNPLKGVTGSASAGPCDVKLPTDANDIALLATLMGEAMYPGSRLYTYATNDGKGNSSHEAAKHPDGYASWDDTYMEMEYMVSVFVNRHNDDAGHPSWNDIANSKQTNGKPQFEGYPNGINALNNLGPSGGPACEQARTGLKAIESIKNIGSLNRNIHFWHSVLQEDKAGLFVRVRSGAIRISGTDFW